MDENILIKNILRFVNKNYEIINIINVEHDQVIHLTFNDDNKLVVKDRTSYTEYVTKLQERIFPEDLNAFFATLSVNKVEDAFNRGEDEVKVKYRYRTETGAYRWFLNIVKYYELEGNKYLFEICEDIENRLMQAEIKSNQLEHEVVNYKQKLESESASMANALYQVNSILDTNSSNGFQIDNTRNYINTVFSNASLAHPELNQALTEKLSEVSNYSKPSLLIVDDSSIIRNSLKRIFQGDFNIITATNGDEAIKIIQDNVVNSNATRKHENIVGLLLDLIMPQSDGFTVLKYMKNFNLFQRIPVAIISGDETKETRKKVYEYEIVDMLEKPFNTDTIRRRIGKIVNLYMSSNNLQNIVAIQDEKISNSDADLIDDYRVIINQVVNNIVTNPESIRLKNLVKAIGVSLANNYPNYKLTTSSLTTIVNTCPLYNIGSIAIRNNIEFTTATIKEEIDYALTIIKSYVKESEQEIANNIAKYSCELFNGKGHPNHLAGNDIPIEAQIVNIAVRLLKSEKTIVASTKKILETESSKYNPDLIKTLEDIKKDIKNI